jgi:hypothetical protein
MYILATASNQMESAEAGRPIPVMPAAISLPNCFASRSTPTGLEWAQPREQMDPDPVVLRFSPDEWNKVASGLVLSPDDLSMIEAGLELLENSQIQLADLAKAEHRTDNIADALEDWAKKIGELAARILEHHSSCLVKLMAAQEPRD